jgi:uncharacterized RDD family membrane protein YckC
MGSDGTSQPGQGWRPRTPPTAAAPAGVEQPTAGAGRPAGFWARFVAFLIDFVVVQAVVGGAVEAGVGRPAVAGAAAFVVTVVYNAWFWWSRGRSPGMLALGLRVVSGGGTLLTPPRAALRALVLELSIALALLPALASALMVGLGRRRAIHDLAAGSEVVRL